MAKKFYRSKSDRKLFGVCGGLAKYFDIDSTIVRALAIVSIFFGTLGIWVYLILALISPSEK
jgi:phage shock protein C